MLLLHCIFALTLLKQAKYNGTKLLLFVESRLFCVRKIDQDHEFLTFNFQSIYDKRKLGS